ncbi:MAG: 23S rRNA (pseudouridine(1915)-N(3))-methyltransferase RlmH [Bacteroides sp.]|nr:23S rRNA (pseudouridine(1915)-N(3))-methyltransferase RlmH [Bacteroides sp.]
MEIQLLTVGKTTKPYIQTGIDEYCRRLKHYINYSIVSLPDIKTSKTLTESIQKEKEGKLILESLTPADFCILLDEHGKELSSMEFSAFIQKIMSSGRKRISFVVGGPYGFCKDVYDRAHMKISLSKMTFTHEMIRLFFTEQLYRAFTILRGEPYHHE